VGLSDLSGNEGGPPLNRVRDRADTYSVPGINRLRRGRADSGDGGFTLVELTVAMGLAAFVFAGLAAVMLGGLRSLAVAKARTQGNEVATQAIEDLQRYSFAELGLCATPASTPPSGLTDVVLLQGGCDGATVEDSCVNQAGTAISSGYTCPRNNITYNVKRYIAWSDTQHTSKRLAVFVTWNDTVGTHTVSQQSSVRSPGVANIVGLSPPSLSNPSVGPCDVSNSGTTCTQALNNGKLVHDIPVSVQTTNMQTTDQVEAVFDIIDSTGNPRQEPTFLTSANGTNWTGSMPVSAGYTFGTGSQFVTFNAIRSSDGKQSSVIYTTVLNFCPSSGSCSNSTLPAITGTSVPGSTVSITPGGALKSSFTVTAKTNNVTTDDSVYVAFMTQSGMISVPLTFDSTNTCNTNAWSACTWTGTVSSTAGYAFSAGTQTFYFTVQQVLSSSGGSVDQGSTYAVSGGTVKFG
jgi:type II secretory pathway pseudopilin PulG